LNCDLILGARPLFDCGSKVKPELCRSPGRKGDFNLNNTSPDYWTAKAVAERVVDAFEIDWLSPKPPSPRRPGNCYPPIDREPLSKDDLIGTERDQQPRRSPTRDEIALADEALRWLAMLPRAVTEKSRKVFVRWAMAKARGRGYIRDWRASTGLAGGSIKHACDTCAGLIADALNRENVGRLIAGRRAA
jgi:hypothetical protein